MTDPRAVFASFYEDPAITTIAGTPRWSVSDSSKRPLDMRGIIDRHEVRGALAPTSQYLVTLHELVAAIPTATNHAFFLDTVEDDLVMLDIEPSCPPAIRDQLLRLPALYRELSLSGRGYHLLFWLPRTARDHPETVFRPSLKDASGWFEILQSHYVTFTRRVLPEPAEPLPIEAWDALYRSVADQVSSRGSTAGSIIATTEAMPEHAWNDGLLDQLTDLAMARSLKPLAEFHGDHSRFEFSALGYLLRRLRGITQVYGLDLDPGHEAWLIFQAANRLLPAREKHSQRRGVRPLLLDRAAYIVGLNTPGDDPQDTDRDTT